MVAVEGASLQVESGITHALVGESGSGKSTLARIMMGILVPDQGRVLFNGADIHRGVEVQRRFRRRIGVVFQDPMSSLDPRMKVGASIAEPLVVHHVGTPAERRKRVEELLSLVDLEPDMARRYPHQFSGGQLQRIAIARALALNPSILILDEPVSALDVSIQAGLLTMLTRLKEKFSLGLLFIAHDLAVVRTIADRVSVMYRGRIVESGPVEEIFSRPRHPYTRTLLSSVPHPNPSHQLEPVGEGREWRESFRRGCVFAHRCPLANEHCWQEVPPLEETEGTVVACFRWREATPSSPLGQLTD